MEESDGRRVGWKRLLLRLDLEVKWVKGVVRLETETLGGGGGRLVDGSRFSGGSASRGLSLEAGGVRIGVSAGCWSEGGSAITLEGKWVGVGCQN